MACISGRCAVPPVIDLAARRPLPPGPPADPLADPLAASDDARLARVVALFEQLTPASLAHLDEVYAADVHFVDPFNDVSGLAPMRRIFEHMFETLQAPRFTVLSRFAAGDEAFLTWDFRFRRSAGGGELLIHGGSHLRFTADGRVAMHRDYWDAAQQVYERLPLLGAVLRWLRRRIAAA